MTTDELLIHELAARAGISVRTIRYYIEEGLLPQPKYQGKYSYYTLKYLDRLELIRKLKESYLPLREIREIMSSLTDDEVHRRLKELSPASSKLAPEQKPDAPSAMPGARALQYINRLMEDQTRYKTKGTVEQKHFPNVKPKDTTAKSSVQPPVQTSPRDDEYWQRVVLSPGVELHLKKPMDPTMEDQVQQLMVFAKELFQNKS